MPRQWAKSNNVQKGDEVEVEECNEALLISTKKKPRLEKVEMDVNGLELMVPRCIHAYYKKGIDELKLMFNNEEIMDIIQNAVRNDPVGFEVIEQGKNYCLIKHVAGEFEGFDPVLRRTFLLLISMADESFNSAKEGNFVHLKNVALLEEANNRLTTSCRRMLNKRGHKESKKVGPLYYIIEDLENLADEYKYLCRYLYNKREDNLKINKETMDVYKKVNDLLRSFYNLFYKFDHGAMIEVAKERKDIIKKIHDLFEKVDNGHDAVILHHLLVITQKIFNFVGPYLVLSL
ncbi:hypothetical protein KY339_02690 [Candidatus Woesearchaeota archaeon]|nr:hypothetical protein [Candidatus Woesearchaeota archaeon]